MRVIGDVDEDRLAALKNGVTVEGVRYKSIKAKLEKVGSRNSWISVTLREGKNREIRRVMEHLGLKVNRLIRTDYGPFALGRLEKASVQEVDEAVLKAQIQGYFKSKS